MLAFNRSANIAAALLFMSRRPHQWNWALLPPLASDPYLLINAVLHVGYSVFLLHAYRFGELSEIYTMAWGHRLF